MLKYKINIIAELKKAGVNATVAKKTGIFGQDTMRKFRDGDTSISLEVLNRLCCVLGMQPQDILEYIETEDDRNRFLAKICDAIVLPKTKEETKMTKRDLMKKFQELLSAKNMCGIEGVNWNSNKSQIQEAIDCLELTDAELDEYMTVFKLKYRNIYSAIIKNGDWKKHQYNRFYVYRMAKMILG